MEYFDPRLAIDLPTLMDDVTDRVPRARLVALLSGDRTAERLATEVFGLRLEITPQTSYLVKLLGIYATVFGLVVCLAARSPEFHPGILYVVVIFCFLGELTSQLLESKTGFLL